MASLKPASLSVISNNLVVCEYMAKIDYQALSQELDELLARMQSGELSIDEAMPAYERGMKLVAELETYLKQAENRMTELQAKLQN